MIDEPRDELDIEFGIPPRPVRKNACRYCGGTGMDGDVGEQGQAITVDCGACRGTGETPEPHGECGQ